MSAIRMIVNAARILIDEGWDDDDEEVAEALETFDIDRTEKLLKLGEAALEHELATERYLATPRTGTIPGIHKASERYQAALVALKETE